LRQPGINLPEGRPLAVAGRVVGEHDDVVRLEAPTLHQRIAQSPTVLPAELQLRLVGIVVDADEKRPAAAGRFARPLPGRDADRFVRRRTAATPTPFATELPGDGTSF